VAGQVSRPHLGNSQRPLTDAVAILLGGASATAGALATAWAARSLELTRLQRLRDDQVYDRQLVTITRFRTAVFQWADWELYRTEAATRIDRPNLDQTVEESHRRTGEMTEAYTSLQLICSDSRLTELIGLWDSIKALADHFEALNHSLHGPTAKTANLRIDFTVRLDAILHSFRDDLRKPDPLPARHLIPHCLSKRR
jgi:hypothetical protein